jgi:hypothetical protein
LPRGEKVARLFSLLAEGGTDDDQILSFLTVFQGVVMLVALASSTRVQARTVSIDFMQARTPP